MPFGEWTVTLQCEGCGVRKSETERYRPRKMSHRC
jgi:hypothetical protein